MNILYSQNSYPIFQNRMYDSYDEAVNCPKGDIVLVEDLRTGLVYNSAFKPELMTYDKNYQNEQALSPQFINHLDSLIPIIDKYIGRKNVIEIGCGKGFFLERLLANGFDISGYDPTYEGTQPFIKRKFFSKDEVCQANGLILRHVLEHIQNPVDFLYQLKEANGGKGKIYIEVPCFEWICSHNAWFDIFYEHVNYFRLSDFKRIFETVLDSGHLFGNQYIYVLADLASLRVPTIDGNDRVKFPSNITNNILFVENNKYKAIWGGASKGVIYSMVMKKNGYVVDAVIDINRAKQDKYLPETGIKVISPNEAMKIMPKDSVIYVMNSNYFDEIVAMSENKFTYIRVDHD